MCITLFALKSHRNYPLVFLSNRDEFHQRDTAPAHWWEHPQPILAGKDLEAGGTWLGIDRNGRIGNLTNYRDFRETQKTDAPSRGYLVTEFLNGEQPAEDYLEQILPEADRFNGFNLLTGAPGNLHYFSNRDGKVTRVPDGIHGLSNHLLNTPWPKVEKGKKGLTEILSEPHPNPDHLIRLMSDTTEAPVSELPDTGGGVAFEQRVSPIFIKDAIYGTRCTTVILIDRNGNISWEEKRFSPAGEVEGWSKFEFSI